MRRSNVPWRRAIRSLSSWVDMRHEFALSRVGCQPESTDGATAELPSAAITIDRFPPLRTAQRLPAHQRSPRREERLVEFGPLVILLAQASNLTEPGKSALHDA